ncbi:MAG: SRPBCC family protein [Bacteroidales bacterium]
MHTITKTRTIAAPATVVWDILRDFNGLERWHPNVTASRLDGSQRIGCVRTLTLANGGTIRERLERLDETAYRCSYALLEGPLPVSDYLGTLAVHPAKDGCVVEWSATMAIHGDAADVTGALGQVYADGLAGLDAAVSARPA